MQNMVFINPLHYTSLLGDSASYVWRTFEAVSCKFIKKFNKKKNDFYFYYN